MRFLNVIRTSSFWSFISDNIAIKVIRIILFHNMTILHFLSLVTFFYKWKYSALNENKIFAQYILFLMWNFFRGAILIERPLLANEYNFIICILTIEIPMDMFVSTLYVSDSLYLIYKHVMSAVSKTRKRLFNGITIDRRKNTTNRFWNVFGLVLGRATFFYVFPIVTQRAQVVLSFFGCNLSLTFKFIFVGFSRANGRVRNLSYGFTREASWRVRERKFANYAHDVWSEEYFH